MHTHPEHEYETEQLHKTIDHMEQKIESAQTRFDTVRNKPVLSHSDLISLEVKKRAQSYSRQNYEKYLDAPYFGRIIYAEENSEEKEDFYIGYIHEELDDGTFILDWRSTFAGAVWDASSRIYVQYKYKNRIFSGQLYLKRNLKIENQAIISISDLIDLRQKEGQDVEHEEFWDTLVDPDDYLRLIIQGKTGQGLEEIVASIQYEQQKIIRENPDQILIIQGSAGTGKTTIALHRISVLTFRESHDEQSMSVDRILIIGSSEGFLEFVASQSILSTLEIGHVKRSTFSDWAMRFSRHKLSVKDKTFYEIIDKNVDVNVRREIFKSSLLKGDLDLAIVLDRFIETYHIQLKINGITCTPKGFGNLALTYRLSPEVAESILSETVHLEYNNRVLSLQNRVIRHFQEQHKTIYQKRVRAFENLIEFPLAEISPDYVEQLKYLIRPYSDKFFTADEDRNQGEAQYVENIQDSIDNAIRSVNREIEQTMRGYFEQHIPTLDAIDLYIKFMNDPDLIYDLAADLYNEDQIFYLTYIPIKTTNDLRIEDLAPIVHLHLALNGKTLGSQDYDHIVVDEAQDLSPLQFSLLRRFVSSASMTILGDMAQSIHSYRGLRDWEELNDVFENDSPKRINLTKTYRSTYEIVSFANSVLDGEILRNRYPLAEPFERYNNEVVLLNGTSQKHHIELVFDKLEEYNERYETIAIIVRDHQQIDWLLENARVYGFQVNSITVPSQVYAGGIVVILAHLVKGMEFQACIIANANEDNYAATLFDGRLLYVGITRALHDLALFWTGEISPHLAHMVE